ncbi:hypothetical protein L596_010705 [Steinernema carpocapsae]|uniref:Innexin n=1 Tax=Steinernema carpocapsae TaxID=34508 RepID=A0A4U5PJR3_STECR|nr:hypothetical protein L596_010705 [Steinernema carpocapsae]
MTDAYQNSDCEEPLMPLYPPGYEPAPDEYVPEKHKIIPEEEDGEKAELEWRPKKFPFFALETADRVSTFKLVVMVTAFLFVATYNTITDVYCFTDGQLVNHSIHDFCRQTQNVHVINSTALILAVETNRTPKASDYYLFKEPVDIHYQRGPWIIGVLVLLAIFDKFCVSGIDCAFFKWIERSRWYDAMQDWPCFQDMVWISVENIMSHTKRPKET